MIHKLASNDEAAQTLPRRTQTIYVLRGDAWLTVDDMEFVLRSGENYRVTSDYSRVMISSIGDTPLQFMLWDKD